MNHSYSYHFWQRRAKWRRTEQHLVVDLSVPHPNLDYVAGFFDADGSVGLYFGGVPRPSISITNCHNNVLLAIKYTLELENIDSRVRPASSARMPCWRLTIESWQGVRRFIDKLVTRTIVKQNQLLVMREVVERHDLLTSRRRGRKNLYTKREIDWFRRKASELHEDKDLRTKHWPVDRSAGIVHFRGEK